ncbi:MAG: hypothetical protein LAO31_18075 [Acidobacteriia bacterium]|nr:hypothetical protein [Terriglobia bacterium]
MFVNRVKLRIFSRVSRTTFLILMLSSAAPAMVKAQEVGPAHSRGPHPFVGVTIRPDPGPDGNISSVGVSLTWMNAGNKGALPDLRIPVVYAGITGIADSVHDLEATDAKGKLPVEVIDDPADTGGFMSWRRWKASREVQWPLNVHYRSQLMVRLRPGPPFALRAKDGGMSGAGAGFLILPDDTRVFNIHLRWDLRNMPPGSSGVSSLGDGDVKALGKMEELNSSYYMAGRIARYPAQGSVDHFSAYWVGSPPFDANAMMAWAAKCNSYYRMFFADQSGTPYRFFLRFGADYKNVGGSGLTNSFMMFFPDKDIQGSGLASTHLIIAHEMVHNWVVGLEGPPGVIPWYHEGLAEYYSRLGTLRAQLQSADDYLKETNQAAVRYYTNPLRNIPNDEVPKLFWKERNAQVIPYDRGSLYFADVDSRLRKASHEKTSLDTIILSMLARHRQGKPLTTDVYLGKLETVLGPSAKGEFESMIVRGSTVVPPSNAFGPCFERRPVQMRLFELGFDEHASLDLAPRMVHGLVSGSAAAAAGLREGDEVLQPLAVQPFMGDPTRKVQFEVRRGDQTFKIEYLPRGAAVEGYEWVKVPGVQENRCALP